MFTVSTCWLLNYKEIMKYHHGNLKENLIQQAVLACEESGWENISLRNLAKQLNVSQTAPYRHFETKEDLHRFISNHLSEREEYYKKCKHIVCLDGKSVEEISKEIKHILL